MKNSIFSKISLAVVFILTAMIVNVYSSPYEMNKKNSNFEFENPLKLSPDTFFGQYRWMQNNLEQNNSYAFPVILNQEIQYSIENEFPSPYCEVSGLDISIEPITHVIFAGIDNTSDAEIDNSPAHEDFTSITGNVNPGLEYEIRIEGNTGGDYMNLVTVFIDWNQDHEFDNEEERYDIGMLVDSDGTDGQQLIDYIYVPTDAALGETRMRIIKKFGTMFPPNGCESTSGFGQVEDYTINVTEADFPQPYCEVEGLSVSQPVTRINFAGIDNFSENSQSAPLHENFIDIIGEVTLNETYEFIAEGNTMGDFTNYFTLFIDWDEDGEFNNENERYEIGTISNSDGQDGKQAVNPITVPSMAAPGLTRMRVIKNSDSYSADGCTSGSEGQAEDYSLMIKQAPVIQDCPIDYAGDLDDGIGDISSGFVLAADFMAEADTVIPMETVRIIMLGTVTSLDVSFYEDNGNKPGTQITAPLTITPAAQTPVAINSFNAIVYELELDMSSYELEFSGGSTGTKYWVGITTQIDEPDGSYWGTSLEIHNGTNFFISTDDYGTWEDLNEFGFEADGAFSINCEGLPPIDIPDCMVSVDFVEPITRVAISNIDNTSDAESNIPVEDFTHIVGDIEPSIPYSITLEGNTNGPFDNYFTVFIDLSESGDWSNYYMEEIGMIFDSTGTDGQQLVGEITLPADTPEGFHIMRVIKNFDVSPTDPCGAYQFGQVEDYTLNILPDLFCSGTPEAGTASAPEEICPDIAFELTAGGTTEGVEGLEYQWQSSPAGENNWNDIEGASTLTYQVADGITSDTDFRLILTCSVNGESDISETATVTIKPWDECYCDINDILIAQPITRVIFSGIDNSSSANSDDVYEDFTNIAPAQVAKGQAYNFTLEGNTAGEFDNSITVFIDWNRDGFFNNEDERYEIGILSNSTGSDGIQVTGSILVPENLENGLTRMRVIKIEDPDFEYATSGCEAGSAFGQVEDYMVMVDTEQGIIDFSSFDFTYYPNPVQDVLNIISSEKIESLQAFNLAGQQVMRTEKGLSKNNEVNVTHLPAGVYIFRAVLNGGKVETFKVIKK